MGKINSLFSGFTGSIGNVTGSNWKGINTVRSKPLSVANPRTAGQVNQRSKFKNVVAFATQILASTIKPLWDRFAQRQSGYNAFVSANIDNFDASGVITPEAIQISKGKMDKTDISSASYDDLTGGAVVNWTDDSGQGFKLATDVAYVVILDVATSTAYESVVGTQRSAGTINVNMPNGLTPTDLKAYLAFRRDDGTVVSNTGYFALT